jgi:peptidoglycan/xylan/chitin deacetylase (PgdA/CDA1 family)
MMQKQDLGVLLFYYLGYSRIRNLVLHLQNKSVARFVLYHDILPGMRGQFEAHLRFLKRYTNVVSLVDYFSGRLVSEKINVVITFDDGYKSWVSHALPILKQLELPATFFVSSGFVGLSNAEALEFLRSKLLLNHGARIMTGGLSIEDLQRIADEGFTVGGHTTNHSILANLRDEVDVRNEVIEDKLKLERIIGNKVDYFAYPSGAFLNIDIDLPKILRDSGYKGALTTISGFNTIESDPYLLHRELTYASMSSRLFQARVYGNYDAVQLLKQWIQRVSTNR